jgi:hypothetical protein
MNKSWKWYSEPIKIIKKIITKLRIVMSFFSNTIRPKNRCRSCNNVWYPRGKNISSKCPECKSTAVEIQPVISLLSFSQFVIICFFIVIFGVFGFVIYTINNSKNTQNDQVGKQVGKNINTEIEVPKENIKNINVINKFNIPIKKNEKSIEVLEKPNSIIVPKNLDKTPILPIMLQPIEDIIVAPMPKMINDTIPPEKAKFVTDWSKIAGYETRVTGVLIDYAPLQNKFGNLLKTQEPILRIWIETKSTTATNTNIRRWGSVLEPAILTDESRKKISKLSLSGVSLRGELIGTHSLYPGAESILDVLAFEVPKANSGELLLSLDAEHLGERGKFRHFIPYNIWKK